MNYKTKFTKEEFLALPVFESKNAAPVKQPFLWGYATQVDYYVEEDDNSEGGIKKITTTKPPKLTTKTYKKITKDVISRYAQQKDYLNTVLEKVKTMKDEDKMVLRMGGNLNVLYWIKHKDGNVSEMGGYIDILDIVGKPNEVPKSITIDIPDVTFSAN